MRKAKYTQNQIKKLELAAFKRGQQYGQEEIKRAIRDLLNVPTITADVAGHRVMLVE